MLKASAPFLGDYMQVLGARVIEGSAFQRSRAC